MKITKSSTLTLFAYLVIFMLPSLIGLFFKLGSNLIWFETVDYLVGAVLLLTINTQVNEINHLESNRGPFLKSIAWGLIGTMLVIMIQFFVNLITIHSGQNPNSENTTTLITLAKINPFFILSISIGAPIMEELVFRKVIFGNFSTMIGANSGFKLFLVALMSSLFFALMHNDGHIFLYTSIGLLFCWLYQKTGRIQTSMIAHILMNTLVIVPLVMS